MSPHRRSAKRRRLSRPPPQILAFSSFARTLSRSAAASSRRRRPYPAPKSPNPNSNSPSAAPKSPNPNSNSPSAAPKSDSSSPSTSSSSGDENQQEMEIVQADFGFFDPKPSDFNGVKLLLQRYLDDRPWDCSGFVDLILEQTTVGTVVKSDGDDEDSGEEGGADDDGGLYAIVSALNLERYGSNRCIGELKKYILDVCAEESSKKELKILLEEQAGDVGVLVSQRFVNCPYQLVPPLYDALFDEISWATEDEPTQELRDSFRFKSYVLVTRVYMNKNVNQHKARSSSNEVEPIIYIKAEDEIFHELSKLSFTFGLHAEQPLPPELSKLSFTFSLHAGQPLPPELKNYREMGLVMIVKADKVPEFRAKLKSLVDESQ